jgi:hypothetical protein
VARRRYRPCFSIYLIKHFVRSIALLELERMVLAGAGGFRKMGSALIDDKEKGDVS